MRRAAPQWLQVHLTLCKEKKKEITHSDICKETSRRESMQWFPLNPVKKLI